MDNLKTGDILLFFGYMKGWAAVTPESTHSVWYLAQSNR